jgi:hypothetical protein
MAPADPAARTAPAAGAGTETLRLVPVFTFVRNAKIIAPASTTVERIKPASSPGPATTAPAPRHEQSEQHVVYDEVDLPVGTWHVGVLVETVEASLGECVSQTRRLAVQSQLGHVMIARVASPSGAGLRERPTRRRRRAGSAPLRSR